MTERFVYIEKFTCYKARCVCGWYGMERRDESRAITDMNAHSCPSAADLAREAAKS